MEGSAYSFAMKLKEKGLNYIGAQDNIAYLQGNFAGHQACWFGVVETTDKQVCTVFVILPKSDKWSTLESDYSNLKDRLTAKYGEPTSCVETFNTSYGEPRDEQSKFTQLMLDNCTYSCIFDTDEGHIGLSIEKTDYEGAVILRYWDNINQNKLEQQIQDDI